MASVFHGAQEHKSSFRADMLTLTFGGLDVSGFLVQSVQFQYAQQVAMLYEIGSKNVYYVGGRAQGSATLARVIGPEVGAGGFIDRFNDLCNPQDIGFEASAGCGGNPGTATSANANYTLVDAVLTTVSVSVTSQEVVINEQLQFIFVDLKK